MIKIISGGQTGVDRMGLEVARGLGLETGGLAPKNFRTEDGFDYSLQNFGLTENDSHHYKKRTIKNLQNADGTVIFGDETSHSAIMVKNACVKYNKPFIVNPEVQELIDFIKGYQINTLNVAGNRASRLTLAQLDFYRQVLKAALQNFAPRH